MLSLNQTFDDTRAIKVLVVPIGSNSLFDSHFSVVSRLKKLSLFDLNRPSTWKTNTQSVKHFNWTTGNLLFDYLRYDRVLNGPGSLDDFQYSRRVLMVMGLVNYPELGTTNVDEDLRSYQRRYPNIELSRVFVFNFSFDLMGSHMPQFPVKDPTSLVIFPPDLECEGGSMVSVHLEEVMCSASVKIIESLERQMQASEVAKSRNVPPTNSTLCTMYDDHIEEHPASVGGGGDCGTSTHPSGQSSQRGMASSKARPTVSRKRLQGRLRKWMGDISLQMCSPIDAVEHYSLAISECRTNGDSMWLAGALEGYATAVLLLLELRLPVEELLTRDLRSLGGSGDVTVHPSVGADVELKVLKLAEERAMEALGLYGRNVVLCALEVECALRLAKMHEAGPAADKDQKALDCVMRARAAAARGLNGQQQIECILEGALVCRRLGMRRKYGLLLYVAGLMAVENENEAAAHALSAQLLSTARHILFGSSFVSQLRKACVHYGVQLAATPPQAQASMPVLVMGENGQNESPAGGHDRDVVLKPSASWAGMRRSLLAYAAYSARQCSDPVATAKYVAALLRLMIRLEIDNENHRQAWLHSLVHTVDTPTVEAFPASRVSKENLSAAFSPVAEASIVPGHFLADSLVGIPGLVVGRGDATGDSLTVAELAGAGRPTSGKGGGGGGDVLAVSSSASSDKRRTISSASGGVGRPSEEFNMRRHTVAYGDVSQLRKGQRQFPSSYSTAHGAAGNDSNASQSLFSPPSFSAVMNAEAYPTTHSQVPAQPATFQSTIEMHLTAFKQAAEDSDLLDVAHVAESLRDGIRRITPVQLPAEFRSMVARSRQRVRSKILQQRLHFQALRGSALGRDGANRIEQRKILALENSAVYEGGGVGDGDGDEDPLVWEYYEDAVATFTSLLGQRYVPPEHQDEALALLEAVTKSVDPGCCIELPVVGSCVRPRLLPLNGLRPLRLVPESAQLTEHVKQWLLGQESPQQRVEASGSEACTAAGENCSSPTKASSLFYDPFAAKQAREQSKRAGVEVAWTVGTVCTVGAVLSNPLCSTLRLHSVQLLVEGADHIAYPCEVELPPCSSDVVVELAVKVLSKGAIRIAGIEVRINNAIQRLLVDDSGRFIQHSEEISVPWKFPRKVVAVANQRGGGDSESHDAMEVQSANVTVVSELPFLCIRPITALEKMHSGLSQLGPSLDRPPLNAGYQSCSASASYWLPICEGEERRVRFGLFPYSAALSGGGDIELDCLQAADVNRRVVEKVGDLRVTLVQRSQGGKVSTRILRDFSSSLKGASSGHICLGQSPPMAAATDSFCCRFSTPQMDGESGTGVNTLSDPSLQMPSMVGDVSGKTIELVFHLVLGVESIELELDVVDGHDIDVAGIGRNVLLSGGSADTTKEFVPPVYCRRCTLRLCFVAQSAPSILNSQILASTISDPALQTLVAGWFRLGTKKNLAISSGGVEQDQSCAMGSVIYSLGVAETLTVEVCNDTASPVIVGFGSEFESAVLRWGQHEGPTVASEVVRNDSGSAWLGSIEVYDLNSGYAVALQPGDRRTIELKCGQQSLSDSVRRHLAHHGAAVEDSLGSVCSIPAQAMDILRLHEWAMATAMAGYCTDKACVRRGLLYYPSKNGVRSELALVGFEALPIVIDLRTHIHTTDCGYYPAGEGIPHNELIAGCFYGVSADICLRGGVDTAVVSYELVVVGKERSGSLLGTSSGGGFIAEGVIVSGKTRRENIRLRQGQSTQHRMQLCFPGSGIFRIYCLVWHPSAAPVLWTSEPLEVVIA